MAKLGKAPIKKEDVEEYLEESSDFAFELRCLSKLTEIGFECDHGEVYEDPITKKTREFDIRGHLSFDFKKIRIAAECKNIRANYPLVAHCAKRNINESFNDLIISKPPDKNGALSGLLTRSSSIRIRIKNPHSLYKQNDYVAKSVDQVGRTKNGIVSNDGSVFEKINQAIHSAYDLIEAAHYEQPERHKITFILPLLIIPDGRLWQIRYKNEGSKEGEVELVENISYFIGQLWRVGNVSVNDYIYYKISHLEIITFSALEKFFNTYFNSDSKWIHGFTDKHPLDLMMDQQYRA